VYYNALTQVASQGQDNSPYLMQLNPWLKAREGVRSSQVLLDVSDPEGLEGLKCEQYQT